MQMSDCGNVTVVNGTRFLIIVKRNMEEKIYTYHYLIIVVRLANF